jgi:hypothetical protein
MSGQDYAQHHFFYSFIFISLDHLFIYFVDPDNENLKDKRNRLPPLPIPYFCLWWTIWPLRGGWRPWTIVPDCPQTKNKRNWNQASALSVSCFHRNCAPDHQTFLTLMGAHISVETRVQFIFLSLLYLLCWAWRSWTFQGAQQINKRKDKDELLDVYFSVISFLIQIWAHKY